MAQQQEPLLRWPNGEWVCWGGIGLRFACGSQNVWAGPGARCHLAALGSWVEGWMQRLLAVIQLNTLTELDRITLPMPQLQWTAQQHTGTHVD